MFIQTNEDEDREGFSAFDSSHYIIHDFQEIKTTQMATDKLTGSRR